MFTTATFIGFLLGGMPGALWATLGIFLPSFLFVAVIYPLVPKLRKSALVAGLLIRFKVNSTWLVLGGATIGLLHMLLH